MSNHSCLKVKYLFQLTLHNFQYELHHSHIISIFKIQIYRSPDKKPFKVNEEPIYSLKYHFCRQKMKNLVLLTILITDCFNCYEQTGTNYCSDYQTVIGIFRQNFINNLDQIEIKKKDFVSELIHNLDPNYVLFINEDLNNLENLAETLNSDPEHSYCKDQELITRIYSQSLERSVTILNTLKSSGITYDNDSIYLGEKFNADIYSIDPGKRWSRLIRFNILHDQASYATYSDSLNKLKERFEKNKANLELKAIEEELQKIQRKLASKEYERIIYYSYINCYLSLIDPHSQYFSNELFSSFREQLSSISASFGIQFEINKDHKYLVSSLKPGSYAWRTGQINLGDEVIELSPDNKSRLNLKNSTFEDFANFFNSLNSDKLFITTINGNNETQTIAVYKEKIENEENVVQAFLINGKQKVGYILLPAFYTFWESDNSSNCAQDLGKALYLLNKEKIQSLILDLRNNGGGSIKEALELAGLFIDFGTLSVERNKSLDLILRKDLNRGMMYTGPLVILTNNASASASEMVAAVLQDYNRAIIIGRKTFGKASGQNLIPVERVSAKVRGKNEKSDFLKVTTVRFYRVTGKTYQRRGVLPDIPIPDINFIKTESESSFKSALQNDSLQKSFFYKALPPLPISYLRNKSIQRIRLNPKYQELHKIDSILTCNSFISDFINLKPELYFKNITNEEALLSQLKSNYFKPTDKFTSSSLYNEKNTVNFYKNMPKADEERKMQLMADPIIEEAYNVLLDYNEIKK